MASSSQPPPPAIPSQPSDIELAKMLRALVDPSTSPPAAGSGNNPPIMIHNADVYAQDPAELTQRFAAAVAEDGTEAWYFFTELLRKSPRGKRKRRSTGSGGVWHGEGKSKPVDVAVRGSEARVTIIGHRNLFAFVKQAEAGTKKDRTGWIMHEFRLPDATEESLVLCKVFRSSRCAPNPPVNNESTAQAVAARETAVAAREAASEEDDASLHLLVRLLRLYGWGWLRGLERLMMESWVAEGGLLQRESDLAAREAAFESRLQALQQELEAELEAFVLMNAPALLLLVASAGIVCRAAPSLPGGPVSVTGHSPGDALIRCCCRLCRASPGAELHVLESAGVPYS